MDDTTNAAARRHQPVLVRETCELLAVRAGDVVLDATVGLGGHARVLAEASGPAGRMIGLDVDPSNLEWAGRRLAGVDCRVHLVKANFADIASVLPTLGVSRVDVLFADLGVSSPQLDEPARGFSFQHDGPLDMRLDPELDATAADLVNRLKEKELGDLIYFNAQERAARRIARRICEARREGRITTTRRLADLVAGAVGAHPGSRKLKIHPATRTFLALRIAVNNELGNLSALLQQAPDVLAPGARFGVIAFHSVEDKPVKDDFRRRKNERLYRIVTKKPVTASPAERKANPRSRSAKLRVAQRLPAEPEA
jgi:16S rRNA (cytosine1402-N4)-methyltransferase